MKKIAILVSALIASASLYGCVAEPAPYYGGGYGGAPAPYYGTSYVPAYAYGEVNVNNYYQYHHTQHIYSGYNNGYWHHQHDAGGPHVAAAQRQHDGGAPHGNSAPHRGGHDHGGGHDHAPH